jgi:hypothetical protein
MAIWYIFPRFGMLYQEKSCNPASVTLSFNLRHQFSSNKCLRALNCFPLIDSKPQQGGGFKPGLPDGLFSNQNYQFG